VENSSEIAVSCWSKLISGVAEVGGMRIGNSKQLQ
jgi:hypothetical protein